MAWRQWPSNPWPSDAAAIRSRGIRPRYLGLPAFRGRRVSARPDHDRLARLRRVRTIDWIEARKELDAGRVGCMGISGGGTCTLFASALEPRIRGAMVSGYLNTFRECIMSLSHCIDNYVPGILNWAEQYDVAGLIAPRPLFAESGERDVFSRSQPAAKVSLACGKSTTCSTLLRWWSRKPSTVRTASGASAVCRSCPHTYKGDRRKAQALHTNALTAPSRKRSAHVAPVRGKAARGTSRGSGATCVPVFAVWSRPDWGTSGGTLRDKDEEIRVRMGNSDFSPDSGPVPEAACYVGPVLKLKDLTGSSGRIRTYNPSVNSRHGFSRLALQTLDLRTTKADYRVNWGDSGGTPPSRPWKGRQADPVRGSGICCKRVPEWLFPDLRSVSPRISQNAKAHCGCYKLWQGRFSVRIWAERRKFSIPYGFRMEAALEAP
jgi:hypothetical protein